MAKQDQQQQTIVVVDPHQAAAIVQQRDREALGGHRLDETVPGGLYIGTDRKYHDSFGRPVTVEGGVVRLASGVHVADITAGSPEFLDRLVRQASEANGAAPEPGTGLPDEIHGHTLSAGAARALGDTTRTEFVGTQESSEQKPQQANLPGDPPGPSLPDEIRKQIKVREYEDMPQNELEVEVAKRGIRGIKGTGDQREGSNRRAVTRDDLIKSLKEHDKAIGKE